MSFKPSCKKNLNFNIIHITSFYPKINNPVAVYKKNYLPPMNSKLEY